MILDIDFIRATKLHVDGDLFMMKQWSLRTASVVFAALLISPSFSSHNHHHHQKYLAMSSSLHYTTYNESVFRASGE
jgi:hypothetical protein